MDRVAVSQLLCPRHETLRAVFTIVRQRVLVGWMSFLVVLQVILVLETHATQFARVFKQLLLVPVNLPLVSRHILSSVKFFVAELALILALIRMRIHVVD